MGRGGGHGPGISMPSARAAAHPIAENAISAAKKMVICLFITMLLNIFMPDRNLVQRCRQPNRGKRSLPEK